jgi:hypothetical protein
MPRGSLHTISPYGAADVGEGQLDGVQDAGKNTHMPEVSVCIVTCGRRREKRYFRGDDG